MFCLFVALRVAFFFVFFVFFVFFFFFYFFGLLFALLLPLCIFFSSLINCWSSVVASVVLPPFVQISTVLFKLINDLTYFLPEVFLGFMRFFAIALDFALRSA